MIAGEKVNVSPRALKALKRVDVKPRAMDNPAKAKEPSEKSGGKNYNLGVSKGGVSFKEAFAHFRKEGKKEFTWNGKRYHTRTKEEETARKTKSGGKAVRRRRFKGSSTAYGKR